MQPSRRGRRRPRPHRFGGHGKRLRRLRPTTSEQIQHHTDDEHQEEGDAAAGRPIVGIATVAAAEPPNRNSKTITTIIGVSL